MGRDKQMDSLCFFPLYLGRWYEDDLSLSWTFSLVPHFSQSCHLLHILHGRVSCQALWIVLLQVPCNWVRSRKVFYVFESFPEWLDNAAVKRSASSMPISFLHWDSSKTWWTSNLTSLDHLYKRQAAVLEKTWVIHIYNIRNIVYRGTPLLRCISVGEISDCVSSVIPNSLADDSGLVCLVFVFTCCWWWLVWYSGSGGWGYIWEHHNH